MTKWEYYIFPVREEPNIAKAFASFSLDHWEFVTLLRAGPKGAETEAYIFKRPAGVAPEFIKVLQVGLQYAQISDKARAYLEKWCEKQEEFIEALKDGQNSNNGKGG